MDSLGTDPAWHSLRLERSPLLLLTRQAHQVSFYQKKASQSVHADQQLCTNEGVSEADGLRGNGHPEAPPISWDDGGLAEEAVHRVDELRQVTLLIFAGYVSDVIGADGNSSSLRGKENSMNIIFVH